MKKHALQLSLLCSMTLCCLLPVSAKSGYWVGNYWYEDGVRQGTYDDPAAVKGYDEESDTWIVRGREIFDPESECWYWLDARYNGARAVNKEVWMPYIYQGDDHTEGKWVRYDMDGRMIKGWYKRGASTYYYDPYTGAMAKGKVVIDDFTYHFDDVTGKLNTDGWRIIDGQYFWYENGIRQGTAEDPKGVFFDGTNRGREIFDPDTDAWYWLDADADGAKATDKDVFIPYTFQNVPGPGKWVRYDMDGLMVKGWNRFNYFLPTTGAMVKGEIFADGEYYLLDDVTGNLIMTGIPTHFERMHDLMQSLDDVVDAMEISLIHADEISRELLEMLKEETESFYEENYSLSYVMLDIETGKGICSNLDELIYSASTVKGPYLASAAALVPGSLDEYYYEMQMALEMSSNLAYGFLRGTLSEAPYLRMMQLCGLSRLIYDVRDNYYQHYSARELAKLWLYTDEFMDCSKTGEKFGSLLENPNLGVIHHWLPYRTRTKAGWIAEGDDFDATGDAGIVYADSGRYLLVILSDVPGDFNRLADLCLLLDEIHTDLVLQ